MREVSRQQRRVSQQEPQSRWSGGGCGLHESEREATNRALYHPDASSITASTSLGLDGEHLYLKDEVRVGWNAGHVLAAVAQVCRYRDPSFSADRHSSNADVPTLDDLARAKLEGERLALSVCYVANQHGTPLM